MFWQEGPLFWLYLPASLAKVLIPYYESVYYLIQLGCEEGRKIFDKEPDTTIQPHS